MIDKVVQLLIDSGAIKFGNFTTKSGRQSPYFLNIGNICRGSHINALAELYAEKVVQSQFEFDTLFGPAYKGIPLVTALACELDRKHSRDIKMCFNRKEEKDHGEGGVLVGGESSQKTLVIDDVLTAGTSLHQSIDYIGAENIVGAMVIIDRCEKTPEGVRASHHFSVSQNIPVLSLATIRDVVDYISDNDQYKQMVTDDYVLDKINLYWQEYCIF